jgi:hypothetical protein
MEAMERSICAALAALLCTVLVTGADGDTFYNPFTEEVIHGALVTPTERHGRALLYVRTADGSCRFLRADRWRVEFRTPESLIQQLTRGGEQKRAAARQLAAMGLGAIDRLEEAVISDDAELSRAAEAIIARIDRRIALAREAEREAAKRALAASDAEKKDEKRRAPIAFGRSWPPLRNPPEAARTPSTPRRPCGHCDGIGTIPCTYCNAVGFLPSVRIVYPHRSTPQNAKVVCPICRGHKKVVCPHCRGTGREARKHPMLENAAPRP